jgi:hypothetical protein
VNEAQVCPRLGDEDRDGNGCQGKQREQERPARRAVARPRPVTA